MKSLFRSVLDYFVQAVAAMVVLLAGIPLTRYWLNASPSFFLKMILWVVTLELYVIFRKRWDSLVCRWEDDAR